MSFKKWCDIDCKSRVGIVFLILALHFTAFSQNTNPVTATIHLVPPYSPYLTDYIAPGSQKLLTSLLLLDNTEPLYSVRLVFGIEGQGIRIQTRPDYRPAPISLHTGIQERLSTEDIAPYFDPVHLVFEGITKEQYQKNGALPEGVYHFSVQAFDVNRNIALSNKAIATAWLTLNDPPFLNNPACGSKVKVLDPQNLVFQWQVRNVSPNSFNNTEYNFRLVQVLPAQDNNSNQAMNSLPPIFETTTEETALHYGITATQLVPGNRYAWRVQAKDKGGKDLYKNNGFSEVCSFTYGDPCIAPGYLKAIVEGASLAKISWGQTEGINKYAVKYRIKKGDSFSEWYTNLSDSNKTTLTNLKPESRYEYLVESTCAGTTKTSLIDTFSTPALIVTDQCGKTFPNTIPENTAPLASLHPNDVLTVDGFTVSVTEATGSNGIYTGKGISYIPFLNAYLKMSFVNIGVNSKYQVVSGNVVADKADLSRYRNVPSRGTNNDFCNDVAGDAIPGKQGSNVGTGTGSTAVNTTKVILINGKTQVREGDKVTINGVETTVSKDTKVEKGDLVVLNGKTVEVNSVSESYQNQDGSAASIAADVVFSASEEQQYGFDKKENDALAGKYKSYLHPVTGEPIYAPWKSVATGMQDKAVAKVENRSSDYDSRKLKLLTESETVVSTAATKEPGKLSLDVSGEAREITAYYQKTDTTKEVLGKLSVVSYNKISKRVVIVPLSANVRVPSAATIQQKLNEVYGTAVAEWTADVTPLFSPEGWDENGDGKIATGDGGLLSNYTGEMRSTHNAFKKAATDFDKNACYLFIAALPEAMGTLGYMPRAKQFGYIFAEGQSEEAVLKSIAHELGHGAFHLKHNFDEVAVTKGSTGNLMDYATGTSLNKYQWDYIHDPATVIGFLEEEEGAALTSDCSWFNGLIMDKDCKELVRILDVVKAANRDKKSLIIRNPTTSPFVFNSQVNLTIENTTYDTIRVVNYTGSGNTITLSGSTYTIKESISVPKFYTISFANPLNTSSSIFDIEIHGKNASAKKDSLVGYLFGINSSKEVVSLKQMEEIFKSADNNFLKNSLPFLNKYMSFFNINTPCRISHFLAQIGVEIGYFKTEENLKENLKYTVCNIKNNLCLKCYSLQAGDKVNCPTNKNICKGKYSGERLVMCENPEEFAGNDEKIANAAYGGFMGRGFIHLTWRSNYEENYTFLVTKGLNPKNFLDNPRELSDDMETAVMSACAFFVQKGCIKEADENDFMGVMNIVNSQDRNRGDKNKLLLEIQESLKGCY